MLVYVSANTGGAGTSAVFRSRIGGSNGNLVVTFSDGATGLLEDTSNSDAISVGSLVCWNVDTSTTITPQLVSFGFETTNDQAQCFANNNADTVGIGLTRYMPIGGNGRTWTATESDVQQNANLDRILSNYDVYVRTNGITAISTFRTRINGANGAQSVAFGSGVTGRLTDTTNRDVVAPTDDINYSLVTGATGTTLVCLQMGCLVEATLPPGLGPLVGEPESMHMSFAAMLRY